MSTLPLRGVLVTCLWVCPSVLLRAQASPPVRDSVSADSARRLGGIQIRAERDPRPTLLPLTLQSTARISDANVQATINAVDAEDAVKYLPSLFVRKRNNGDTQSTLASRVWGVSSSARSLVFADGVPLTALIANNNNIGGPRWGMVAPDEIRQVDVMYGPFSAAYAGNSMGAVVDITTRMPERREGSLSQTQTIMPFSLYGTRATYATSQTTGRIAERVGALAISLHGGYTDSHSQPLSYATAATFPPGTSGGYPATNKLNQAANILGATGVQHTRMLNGTAKLAYDLTPTTRATYTYTRWHNDGTAGTETYLTQGGTSTFAGVSGFASGTFGLQQQHVAQSLSLRTDRRADWDAEAVASSYAMIVDRQRFPSAAPAIGDIFGKTGKVTELSGTRWATLDLKAAWHAGGIAARHVLTAGAHVDRYRLQNPTWNTADWTAPAPVFGTLASTGTGATQTSALWMQDRWRVAPSWTLTAGVRAEWWHAFDGENVSGAIHVTQPERRAARVSPKAVLTWTGVPDWTLTASIGQAYRFATTAELYQLVTTGTTFTAPDASLKPDNVLATEVRAERSMSHGRLQVALFQDRVRDAILSQYQTLVPGSATLYAYLSNVDRIRARGIELSGNVQDLGVEHLELTGSVTYLDARTLALSGRASSSAAPGAAIGKRLPNIPDWRVSGVATYRPTSRLAVTLAGRYAGALWTTLDNTDVNPNVYQGFSAWAVVDARLQYRWRDHLSVAVGADNLLNRTYFLFHPFPQRTYFSSVAVTY